MHFLESYSLQGGAKISKPYVLEKYFALPFDKYITFQPFSRPAKNYSFYLEVIKLILPILEKNGIKIVQIGAKNEPVFDGVFSTVGKTNIGNVAYLIKNSLLYFGADSISAHFAGTFNIPLVSLYAANYSECVRPYFGNKEKQIIIEGDRKGNKPTFSLDENPKTIDTIKPEIIAESIFKLLNIEWQPEYKTLLINPIFNNKIIEVTLDQPVDPKQFNLDCLVARMDFNFNENVLIQQSLISKLVIVIDKPLAPSCLKTIASQIKEINYEIKENYCLDFIKMIIGLGIKLTMFSYLPTEKLNEIKFQLMDLGIIHQKSIKTKNDFPEIKDYNNENLYYRTNKFTIYKGKIYQSLAAIESNNPLPSFVPIEQPIIDNEKFWREWEFHYYLLKK